MNHPPFKKNRTFYIVCAILLLLGLFVIIPNKIVSRAAQSSEQVSAEISYQGVEGKTALDLLKANHQVDSQKYDFGEYVTGIDGKTAAKDQFWAFYVNGSLAQTGADQYVTHNNDTITWKLEKIQ